MPLACASLLRVSRIECTAPWQPCCSLPTTATPLPKPPTIRFRIAGRSSTDRAASRPGAAAEGSSASFPPNRRRRRANALRTGSRAARLRPHHTTPASEATDGIASPQHRRCASSRRRPSRGGRGDRVGTCQFVSGGGMARELFPVARRSCGCAAGKRQPSRRDAIGSADGVAMRDARAGRQRRASWCVHCHSSCPSP